VRKLYTRGKYLRIKEDAHELPYNILTLLLKKFRSAGLRKKKNRGEEEFKAPDKIIPLITVIISSSISKSFITPVLSVNISSIFNSRIF
jgi:hypothetical protein